MDILEKYALPDGGYERDGIYYNDVEGMLGARMNFCGCGMPQAALIYVYNILEFTFSRHDDDYHNWMKYSPDGMFTSYGEEFFVFYTLESHGFLEHGSNACHGWLTPDGKEFLEELRAFKSRIDSGQIERNL